MKKLIYLLSAILLADPAKAAQIDSRGYDTNTFVVNTTTGTVTANTNGSNPKALATKGDVGSFVSNPVGVPVVYTSTGTNIIYVDSVFGSDANHGTSWSDSFKTITVAVTNSWRSINPTIQLKSGVYYIDGSQSGQCTVTNTRIVGAGLGYNGTVIVTTTNLGSGIASFDSYGSFEMIGVRMLNTNIFCQYYPLLIHTKVGNGTNLVHLKDCYIWGSSDDIATTGTTTGGKTYPEFLEEGLILNNEYDGHSIGVGTNGFRAINCVITCDATFAASHFGGGAILHGAAFGGTTTTTVEFDNCVFKMIGGTNQYCIDISDPNMTVNIKNCVLETVPGPTTVDNLRVLNEGASTVNFYDTWNDTGISNITGVLNFKQGSTTNIPIVGGYYYSPDGTNAAWTLLRPSTNDSFTLATLNAYFTNTTAYAMSLDIDERLNPDGTHAAALGFFISTNGNITWTAWRTNTVAAVLAGAETKTTHEYLMPGWVAVVTNLDQSGISTPSVITYTHKHFGP